MAKQVGMAVGTARNQPCSCGSGKKYKVCCLRREPALQYSDEDRRSLLRALEDFAGTQIDIDASMRSFFERGPDDDLDAFVVKIKDVPAVRDCWLMWAILDDPEAGVVPAFRKRFGSRLGPGQRTYLNGLAASSMRLYAIVSVEPGAALHLRDALSDATLAVVEHTESQELLAGDLIAARIMPGGDSGTFVIEHPWFSFTQTEAVAVLEEIHTFSDLVADTVGADTIDAGLRLQIPVIAAGHWLEKHRDQGAAVGRSLSDSTTVDGERRIDAYVTFDIQDGEQLRKRLADSGEFDVDRDRYTWTGKAGSHGMLRTIRIFDDELHCAALSLEGAYRLKEVVERVAGDAVEFRVMTLAPGREMLPFLDSGKPLTDEEQALVIGIALTNHYDVWVNARLRELDDHTPREAAADPKVRPKLVALLRGIDARNERSKHRGDPVFDFTHVWRDLGLEKSRHSDSKAQRRDT
jgi:SEC-C motif-containing protein